LEDVSTVVSVARFSGRVSGVLGLLIPLFFTRVSDASDLLTRLSSIPGSEASALSMEGSAAAFTVVDADSTPDVPQFDDTSDQGDDFRFELVSAAAETTEDMP
jgi:hypothetical protein